MFRDKMKVVTTTMLALALVFGALALSSTSIAFAASTSSRPSLKAPQSSDGIVPGSCNWDNDQDQDDWCWQVSATNTVVPYGSVTGQTDPGADYSYNGAYGYASPYAYYGGGYGRLYYFGPFGMRNEERIERRLGLPPDENVLPFRGRVILPNGVIPWWMR